MFRKYCYGIHFSKLYKYYLLRYIWCLQLKFEDDLKITQMFSAEEECVNLEPTLYPTGNVENWLAVVENSMKNTVRVTLGKSLTDMMTKERKDWVLCWPGQVVIACCQTFWTAGLKILCACHLLHLLNYIFRC